MTQPSQLVRHLVAKVRRLDSMPEATDHARAWATVRPFPPGLAPIFMGSVWFWHDGRPDPRMPSLHLLPVDHAESSPLRYLNLFHDHNLGGTSLLDTSAGWRRLDFLFSLPEDQWPVHVRALVLDPRDGRVVPSDAGELVATDGLWRFDAKPGVRPPLEPPSPGPLRPGFIGGAPKSGTTWMQMLLNQHDAIFATGEGALLRQASMRPYRSTNWWFPPNTPQSGLNHFANHAVLTRVLNLYRDFTGCGWVVDKSPGNARMYRLILSYVPGARLIHCVRHPLDVVVSRIHHEASIVGGGTVSPEMAEHAEAVRRLPALLTREGALMLDQPTWAMIARILDEYAEVQTEALETLRARPGRLVIVRYEDMLKDAQGCAARVFAHLGVASTPAQTAHCVQNASFGNLRERRDGRPHPFFRSGTKGQYEGLFSAADQARAMDYLRARLPQFNELGYALEPA